MARVLVYERDVNAVLTSTCEKGQLNLLGVKIKEEPPDVEDCSDHSTFSPSHNGERKFKNIKSISKVLFSDEYSNNKENECSSTESIKRPTTDNSTAVITKKRQHATCGKTDENTAKRRKRHDDNFGSFKELSSSDKYYGTRSNRRSKISITDNSAEDSSNISKPNLENGRAYKCDVCSIEFYRKSQLQSHTKCYNRKKKFTCNLCNVSFNGSSDLKKHKSGISCSPPPRGHGKFTCTFCHQNFFRKEHVQAHLFHLHNEKMVNYVDENNISYNNMLQEVQKKSPEIVPASNTNEAENNHISSQTTPMKKMRQPTLIEFLQFSAKKQQTDSPKNTNGAKKDLARTSFNVSIKQEPSSPDDGKKTSLEKETSSTVPDIQKPAAPICNKPFVQIHIVPDVMKSLLSENTTVVKTENIEEEPNTNATLNCERSYDLRSTRNYASHESVLENSAKNTRRRARRRTNELVAAHSNSSKSELPNTSFTLRDKCKECIIPLSRCDKKASACPSQMSTTPASNGGKVGANASTTPTTVPLKQVEVSLSRLSRSVASTSEKSDTRGSAGNASATKFNVDRKIQGQKIHSCKTCKKSFITKEKKRKHVKLFHVAYMSSICNARYTVKQRLLDHYWRQHTVRRRKECCVCHQRCSTSVQLKQHLVVHCLRMIRSKDDSLPLDVELHCNRARKQNKCEACGKRFWLKSCLKQHQQVCRLYQSSIIKLTKQHTEKKTKGRSKTQECAKNNAERIVMRFQRSNGTVISHRKVFPVNSPAQDQTAQTDTKNTSLQKPDFNSTDIQLSIEMARRTSNQIATSDQLGIPKYIKEVFPCTICGVQFHSVKNLTCHKRAFAEASVISCRMCQTLFPNKRLLRFHFSNAHISEIEKSFRYQCRFCKQGFSKKTTQRSHEWHIHTRQMLSSDPVEDWSLTERNLDLDKVCNICNLMFETRDRYVEHSMYYYKGHVFMCAICGKPFQGVYILHHHIKVDHCPDVQKSYNFLCDICNEGFNHQLHFHAHKMHVHVNATYALMNSLITSDNQSKSVVEQNCNPVTDSETSTPDCAGSTITTVHMCKICKFEFKEQADLTSHENEYSATGEFECDTCLKRYVTVSLLNKHKWLNHISRLVDTLHKCCVCNEVFLSKISLICHEKHCHQDIGQLSISSSDKINITTEQNSGNHQYTKQIAKSDQSFSTKTKDNSTCSTCGITFGNKTDLEDHLEEYVDTGNYACDKCGKQFGAVRYLTAHELQHAKVNPLLFDHPCLNCQEKFSSVVEVAVHTIHLHKKDGTAKKLPKRNTHMDRSVTNQSVNAAKELSKQNTHTDRSVTNRSANANIENILLKDHAYVKKLTTTPALPVPLQGQSTSEKTQNPEMSSDALATEQTCTKDIKTSSENSQTDFRGHKIEHTESYICDYCGERFHCETQFNEHQEKHLESNSALTYDCPICNKKFSTVHAVRSHIACDHPESNLRKNTVVTEQEQRPNNKDVLAKGCTSNQSQRNNITTSTDKSGNTDSSRHSVVRYVSKDTPIDIVTNPVTQEQAGTTNTTVKPATSEKGTPKTVTKNVLLYACPLCPVRCPSPKSFQNHYKTKHPIPAIKTRDNSLQPKVSTNNSITCVVCHSTFSEELQIKEHMEKVHASTSIAKIVPINNTKQTLPSFKEIPVVNRNSNAQDVARDTKREKPSTIVTGNVAPKADAQSSLNVQQSGVTTVAATTEKQVIRGGSAVTVRSDKVGKLKVRPFAKIIEDLTKEKASAINDSQNQTVLVYIPPSGNVSVPTASNQIVTQPQLPNTFLQPQPAVIGAISSSLYTTYTYVHYRVLPPNP